MDWVRDDINKPIRKMAGRFYNDTDQTMGEVEWTRNENTITETTQEQVSA
ncbi:hypothetical protein MACH09_46200 [Vibrio sp. MACH09]|nr:hypothetical protein MACH09_46200 [Vibrio sp. MACH09]